MKATSAVRLELSGDQVQMSHAIVYLTEQVKNFVKVFCPNRPFNIFHFRLAMDEGLLNALEHGCKKSGKQNIQVTLTITEDQLELSVEDPGFGFDYEDSQFNQSRSMEEIMNRGVKKAKGWGLAIIQSVASAVYWNERGNRITLSFFPKVQ